MASAALVLAFVGSSAAACVPRTSGLNGVGSFMFDRPGHPSIPVYFVTGDSVTPDATILIVLHGVERNAEEYRDSWTEIAQDRDLIVVAPEFSDGDFPGAAAYNLGGLPDGDEIDGAYGYIEPLFEDTRRRAGGNQTTYELFGHSAGAQFVHRFVMFAASPALATAVAANAGWYTMPDDRAEFPFGLDGRDAPHFDARGAFGRQLVILLGTDDTGTDNLRQGDDAGAQGETRWERGNAFYDRAERAAARADVPFAWQLATVPDVDHDHARMAEAAVPFLCGPAQSCHRE